MCCSLSPRRIMGSPPQLQLSISSTGHDPREHTETSGLAGFARGQGGIIWRIAQVLSWSLSPQDIPSPPPRPCCHPPPPTTGSPPQGVRNSRGRGHKIADDPGPRSSAYDTRLISGTAVPVYTRIYSKGLILGEWLSIARVARPHEFKGDNAINKLRKITHATHDFRTSRQHHRRRHHKCAR